MRCPICDFGMSVGSLTTTDESTITEQTGDFKYCQRCGTFMVGALEFTPRLVTQCRSLIRMYEDDERISNLLRRYSIVEAVTLEPVKGV